jgi:ADP-heptose:LPS heptosyltransferase
MLKRLGPLPDGPCRRILFVTATRIGDAVLSTGLLARLLDRYPEARVTIVAGPVAAPLFTAVPRLERLIALAKRSHSRHWLDLYPQIAATRWDLVVDLRGSALSWLLWTRHRRVMAKGDPSRHRMVQLARLFAADPPPAPHLWTGPDDEAAADRLLGTHAAPILGIGPSANWGAKQWRTERFIELAQRLTAPGAVFPNAPVAVFAAPQERAIVAPVLAALPADRRIDLVDAGALSVVAACLRRCRMFIGNDSGLMHMAAAVGTPTLGLFGPSPVEQYGPWGNHCATVLTTISCRDLITAPGFDHRRHETLMDTLTVDAAAAGAVALAARTAHLNG